MARHAASHLSRIAPRTPTSAPDPVPAAPRPEARPQAPTHGRVLLIDPDPQAACVVADWLEKATGSQPHVLHVLALQAGLRALASDPVDAVVTDLSLPDARGFDAVVRIHAAAPHTAIIVQTSLDDETFALRVLEQGAQDYLVKGTFDGAQLARSIAYACKRKALEERLLYMTQYDELTGLRNRAIFRDRLAHLLQRARRESRAFTLLRIHLPGLLEGFQGPVQNDPPSCEALLRQLARRLQTCLRDSDTLARLADDQFAALLENTDGGHTTVGERIHEALALPFELGAVSITLRARIAAARYPTDADTAEGLLRLSALLASEPEVSARVPGPLGQGRAATAPR